MNPQTPKNPHAQAEEIKGRYAWLNDKWRKPAKNPNAVALGRLGGKAGRGHVKARTSAQARAAVMVRWAKRDAVKCRYCSEPATCRLITWVETSSMHAYPVDHGPHCAKHYKECESPRTKPLLLTEEMPKAY